MLKKIIQTFGIRAFSAFVNLLIAVVLSRYLGPDGKGNQNIIITTISIILIFANLVGGATLVYLVPRYKAYLLLIPSYAWSVLMGVFSYLILTLTGLVAGEYIFHISLLAVINSMMSIHSNVLIGQQRIKESNQLVWMQSVTLILTLLIAFAGFKWVSVFTYLLSLYISFGICLIVSAVYIRASLLEMQLMPVRQFYPVVRKMVNYGFQNQVAHITQLMSFRLSYYILEEYKGMASVGVFGNGISIAESIWLISKSMSLVQYSWVSNSEDREQSARLTMQMVKAGIVMSLLLIIPLMLLPVSAYLLVFGPGFEEVRMVVWTLAPGVLVYNLSILLGHYYSGTGRYYINTRISSLGLLLSVFLYYTMIPFGGIAGAGWATSISYAFTSLLFLWYFGREFPAWYRELRISKNDFNNFRTLIINKIKNTV